MTNRISDRTADGSTPTEAVSQVIEELSQKHGFISERRKHHRYPWCTDVSIMVKVGLDATTYTINAATLNISLGGLRCLSPDPIVTEREVRVRFEELKNRPVFSAVVHSCEPVKNGSFYKLSIELLSLAD